MYPQQPQTGGDNYYRLPEKQPKQRGLAITSFVLSLLPIFLTVFCCCLLPYPSAASAYILFLLLMMVIALCTGIFSLISHRGGKGFAITGIIISALLILPLLFSLICVNTVYYKDMAKFAVNAQEYIDDYDRTGEVPEDFEKYKDPKYDNVWKSMGYDDFDAFYGDYMIPYYKRTLYPSNSNESSHSGSSNSESKAETTTRPANYGENPITI